MRVTPTTMHNSVLAGLQASLSRVQSTQTQLATGKRLNRFSDSPADASTVLRMRAEESDWASYAKAADDGTAWLNTQDQALQSASTLLRRVRELTVASAQSTTLPAEREAMATEIEGIRDQLAGIANTSYQGQSVFGGFASRAVTQVGGVWTWSGDSGAVQRRVTPETVVQVNSDGANVFGFAAGQTDVFSELTQMATDMRAGNTAALGGAHLTELDARMQGVTTGLAVVGARASLVEASRQAGMAQQATLKETRSGIEDLDVAQAALDMQLAQMGYQAALAAAGRLAMPTLANFLQ